MHADIKPQNVLLFKEGEGLLAKVNDFGCTRAGATENDMIKLTGATPKWMAPEQPRLMNGWHWIGEAKKADTFSFGKVCAWLLFWQELTGDIPDDEQDFDFAEAMNSLLKTEEAKSGELSNQDFLAEVKPLLKGFFDASYTIESEPRESMQELSSRVDAILRCWELK